MKFQEIHRNSWNSKKFLEIPVIPRNSWNSVFPEFLEISGNFWEYIGISPILIGDAFEKNWWNNSRRKKRSVSTQIFLIIYIFLWDGIPNGAAFWNWGQIWIWLVDLVIWLFFYNFGSSLLFHTNFCLLITFEILKIHFFCKNFRFEWVELVFWPFYYHFRSSLQIPLGSFHTNVWQSFSFEVLHIFFMIVLVSINFEPSISHRKFSCGYAKQFNFSYLYRYFSSSYVNI
jgi:hypothetical protein